MKSAIYCSVFTLVSLWTLSSFGQSTCPSSQGGGYPTNSGPGYPYDQPTPYGQPSPYSVGGSYNPTQIPASYLTSPLSAKAFATAAAPAGPTAKITVVSAGETSSVAAK